MESEQDITPDERIPGNDEFTPEEIAELERQAAEAEANGTEPEPESGGIVITKDLKDFEERVLAAARAVGAEPRRTDLPLRNEAGYEMLSYNCWKCKRPDIIADNVWTLYREAGVHPFCLACQHDNQLFRWRQDEQGRDYLQPVEGAMKKRVGEAEAARLERLGYERVEKFTRREELIDIKARVDAELAAVDNRLIELETEIPAAQDALQRVMNDPDRDLKQQIADLERKIQKSQARAEILKTRARRERSAR